MTSWDDRQTAFIFKLESSLGTKWMALFNGHIIHYAYNYFTYRHDRMERCCFTYPTLECLQALHDLEVKPHLIEMGLGPVIEYLPCNFNLQRICQFVSHCQREGSHYQTMIRDQEGAKDGINVKIVGEKEGVSLAAFSHTQWGNTHKGGG